MWGTQRRGKIREGLPHRSLVFLVFRRIGKHRRNITTSDVPLNHLVDRPFRIGEVILLGTRLSTPCRHIEHVTRKEIFSLLLNRSGLHAKILHGGVVRIGDAISPV